MTKIPGVTLLIMHYNRSQSLERLLKAFRALDVGFDDIVVSDDASKPEHQERLRALEKEYGFRLITTPVNRGLGHNNNKGQDAVRTPYTLYVQEDFVPTENFPKRYQDAFDLMEEDKGIDLVKLFTWWKFRYTKPVKNGFSELQFNFLSPGHEKFLHYGDHPHLRRSNFFEKFGRYAEGIKAIQTEKHMAMSFLQARGRAVEADESNIFVTENTAAEPSTQNYNTFFKIRAVVPPPIFNFVWMVKLSAQYLLKTYRH